MEDVLESRQGSKSSALSPLSFSLLLNLVGEPLPEVAQQECQSDEEQAIERIARGGTGAGLVELPVTGLDAKASPVSFTNLGGRASNLPGGKQPLLLLAFAGAMMTIRFVIDHQGKHHTLGAVGMGVGIGTRLLLPIGTHSLGCLSLLRFSATHHHGHDEGQVVVLKPLHHLDVEEVTIQQHQFAVNPAGFELFPQTLEDGGGRLLVTHPGQRQRVTPACDDDAHGGIDMKRGGAPLWLVASQLPFVFWGSP